MIRPKLKVLVIGATGSVGRLVVAEAIRQGHAVRALVRGPAKAHDLLKEVEVLIGDLTRPDTLNDAVNGSDLSVQVDFNALRPYISQFQALLKHRFACQNGTSPDVFQMYLFGCSQVR